MTLTHTHDEGEGEHAHSDLELAIERLLSRFDQEQLIVRIRSTPDGYLTAASLFTSVEAFEMGAAMIVWIADVDGDEVGSAVPLEPRPLLGAGGAEVELLA